MTAKRQRTIPGAINEPARAGTARSGSIYTRRKVDSADVHDPNIITGCRENMKTYAHAEEVLARMIDRGRSVDALKPQEAELVNTAFGWCENCPIQRGCYRYLSETGYTGLAGGNLLYRGKPYLSRSQAEQARAS
jgi:hypothetical protein